MELFAKIVKKVDYIMFWCFNFYSWSVGNYTETYLHIYNPVEYLQGSFFVKMFDGFF